MDNLIEPSLLIKYKMKRRASAECIIPLFESKYKGEILILRNLEINTTIYVPIRLLWDSAQDTMCEIFMQFIVKFRTVKPLHVRKVYKSQEGVYICLFEDTSLTGTKMLRASIDFEPSEYIFDALVRHL
jgi:hypothetical protein